MDPPRYRHGRELCIGLVYVDGPSQVLPLNYGPAISNILQLDAFGKDELQPTVPDRTGAPTEPDLVAMIARPKATYPMYNAADMAWRVWAGRLVKHGMTDSDRDRLLGKVILADKVEMLPLPLRTPRA